MHTKCGRFLGTMVLVAAMSFAAAAPVNAVGWDSRQFLREASPLGTINLYRMAMASLALHRQVVLAAQIVQINRIMLSTLGVDWQVPDGDSSDGSETPSAQAPADELVPLPVYEFVMFYRSMTQLSIDVTLAMLGGQQTQTLLSAPHVTTVSGGRGYILAGRSQPQFASESALGTEGAGAAVGTVDTGLKLDFQPIITADGSNVILHIRPSVSLDLTPADGQAASANPVVDLPFLNLRRVNTTVSVPDGGTLLLGGLTLAGESRVDEKVPLLSDVPLLGHLFGRSARSRDQRQLTIMLTPRIVQTTESEGGALAGGRGHSAQFTALAEAEAQHLLDASARARQRAGAAAPDRGWEALADTLERVAQQRAASAADLSLAMRVLLADPALVRALGGDGDYPLDLRGARTRIDADGRQVTVAQAALITAGVHLADVRHVPTPEVMN